MTNTPNTPNTAEPSESWQEIAVRLQRVIDNQKSQISSLTAEVERLKEDRALLKELIIGKDVPAFGTYVFDIERDREIFVHFGTGEILVNGEKVYPEPAEKAQMYSEADLIEAFCVSFSEHSGADKIILRHNLKLLKKQKEGKP